MYVLCYLGVFVGHANFLFLTLFPFYHSINQCLGGLHRLDKKESEKRDMVRQAVENKVNLLLTFMASEYDDISAAVFDFARDYIQVRDFRIKDVSSKGT